MRTKNEIGLNRRLGAPLALALAAGALVATPVMAQGQYYEDKDEPDPGPGYHYRAVNQAQTEERDWYEPNDVSEWFDEDDGDYVQYRSNQWEANEPDAVIYDQYYTVEYQPREGATREQDATAEDTDYYYDPYQKETRERARVHNTEPPVRTQRQQTSFSTQVNGALQSYREINLQGQPEPHTVVKVRTNDGRIALVDLGPRVDLRQMNLEQGDMVVAEGRRGTINNEPVLIATSIRAEGQSRQLRTSGVGDDLWLQGTQNRGDQAAPRRERPPRAENRGSMTNRDMQRRQYRTTQDRQMTAAATPTRLHGDLQSFGRVQLQGQQDAHTIVEMRLDDGQRALVNLGPRVDPQDLNLKRGDTITVEGRRGRINQQPVLMATSIEVNGERTQIQQPRAMNLQQDNDLREQDESGYLYTTERVAQTGETGQGQDVSQIVASWPSEAKDAAEAMQRKYGQPDVKTSEMLIWKKTGPFEKTIVHKEAVRHDFPTPHKDVLEQCVKYEAPADKMDELAQFDGSLTVRRTDGLMCSRCNSEEMNILALNLADQIVKGDLSVDEARDQLAETARAYEQGQRLPMTQELQFKTSGSTEQSDTPNDDTDTGPLFDSGGSS